MQEFSGMYKRVNDGLKTKLDISNLKYKKTFKEAKKLGIDLMNTNKFFKKNNWIFLVSVTSYTHRGIYREKVNILPYLQLKKIVS